MYRKKKMNTRDAIYKTNRRKHYTLYQNGIKVFTSYTTLMTCDNLDDLITYTEYHYPKWFKEYLKFSLTKHRDTFTITFHNKEESISIMRHNQYYEPLYLKKHNMACKYGQKTHHVF